MFCKLVFETKYFLAEWTRMVSRLVVGCGQMLLQAVTMRKYLKNMINVWFMSFGQGVEFRNWVLNVKYLLLLSFLTAAKFFNLGHIQGLIRVH